MIRSAITAFALLLFASPAFAHAIRVKVEVTPTEVRATVRYDGAEEDGGQVEVKLSSLEPSAEIDSQKLGPDGSTAFPRPEPGKYRIVAADDFGHRVVVDFEVPLLGQTASAGSYGDGTGGLLTLGGIGIIAGIAFVAWRFTRGKK